MAKKKQKQMVELDFPKKRYIHGAFVNAHYVDESEESHWFDIKLSSINSIQDFGEKGCLFSTYKDCQYWIPTSAFELRKAINSFIFEPDTHWERYGN